MSSRIPFMLFVALMQIQLNASTASYNVLVLDNDSNEPVKDAEVNGGFVMGSRGWDNTPPANMDRALTGDDGLCRLKGNTDVGRSYFWVEKVGYYKSARERVEFNGHSILKLGRWLPDNLVVTARIDHLTKPIPLYIRVIKGVRPNVKYDSYESAHVSDNHFCDIVTTNTSVFAFDFIEGDWLPPFGGGRYADMTVACRKEPLGHEMFDGPARFERIELFKFNADIKFNGEGNGLCEMKTRTDALLKIRTAPELGYETRIRRSKGRIAMRKYIDDSDKNRCYCFRIRTQYDEKGRIKKAYYGKVYGDFRVNDARGIVFTYYLNVTLNDRNLEFDQKTNLYRVDRSPSRYFAP